MKKTVIGIHLFFISLLLSILFSILVFASHSGYDSSTQIYYGWDYSIDLNKLAPYPQCWEEDSDQTDCEANASRGCVWYPAINASTNQQNAWCKNATGCCRIERCDDYQFENNIYKYNNETRCRNLINDSGLACKWVSNGQYPWCEQVFCSIKTGISQNACENSSFLGGKCQWSTTDTNTWCYNSTGCCQEQTCKSNWNQNLTKCYAIDYCTWNGTNCTDGWAPDSSAENGTTVNASMSTGCGAKSNNSASCLSSNWCTFDNASGLCNDPFANDVTNATDYFGVHCWAFDRQPHVCQNITGCIYCDDDNTANVSSFCNKKQPGWCEGHQEDHTFNSIGVQTIEYNRSLVANKENNWTSGANMNCSDFNVNTSAICDCGPLPGCQWDGTECRTGLSQCNIGAPPVTSCNGKLSDGSKITQGICEDLKNKYFMNCAWNNKTNTCDFDWGTIGDTKNSSEGKDYFKITSEDDCTAAKGTWRSEAYCEGSITKYDTWCELASGKTADNCDDVCSACDWFFPNESAVTSAAQANASCSASTLGYCNFTTDSFAPNTFGRCDAPQAIYFGESDCNIDCAACALNINNASGACNVSVAACHWDTPTNSCISNSTKGCSDSCFSCYDTTSCTASSSNCTWDANLFYCKASGISIEVCFDGIDNDNDGNVDCGDGDCAYDSFCGGGVGGGGGGGGGDTCSKFTAEADCTGALGGQTGQNCVWIDPQWGSPYCGMPGSNCWQYDSNKTGCNTTTGCNWTINVNSFCDVNWTSMDNCSKQSISTCATDDRCAVRTDSFTGSQWCEFFAFSCATITNVSGCMANENCTWQTDSFFGPGMGGGGGAGGGGGHCEVVCFNNTLTSDQCNLKKPICESSAGMCEPTMFSVGGAGQGGCFNWNGNQSGCKSNNGSCEWHLDGKAPAPDFGWCDPKGAFLMFNDLKNFMPDQVLGTSDANTSLGGEIDIRYVTIKETGSGYLFETGVRDVNNSAFCNGFNLPGADAPIGSGMNTTRFYYYLDTNGVTSDGCTAPLGGSVNHSTKFDFLITHVITRSTATSDSKSFQRCVSGEWSPTNTVVTTKPSELCPTVYGPHSSYGAIGVMVEKESFNKFPEFIKTSSMRILVTSADANGSRTAPNDTTISTGTGAAGFYAPGSVGFTPVDCSAPGSAASNPKCSKLKIFGYIQKEDCFSPGDDEGDGLVNCNDIDCKTSPNCASSGVNSPDNQYYWGDDKTAPAVLFSNVQTYPDGAFVKYDTDEPANGTLQFYDIDNNCTTINKSIRDIGILNPSMPAFKSWHEAPIDNFAYNPDPIDHKLTNGSVYHYALKICDEAGNCATSACLNFTTAKSSSKTDCPSCNTVFKFTPPTGMSIKYDFGDGYVQQNGTACGVKINYTQSKKAKLMIQDSTTNLSLQLVNISIGGKISENAKTFNSSELQAQSSVNVAGVTTGCVGLTKEKFEKLKSSGMVPEKVIVQIPIGTEGCTTLTQCDACESTGDSCETITNNTGVQLLNATAVYCEWLVPASSDYI